MWMDAWGGMPEQQQPRKKKPKARTASRLGGMQQAEVELMQVRPPRP